MEELLFVFWAGGMIGYMVLLVAVWRGMKAHESIAESVREAVDLLRARSGS
jgi:hypothetical protein